MENDIKNIITYLNEINAKYVHIMTTHKLFGTQSIKCALKLIYNKERIGFLVKDHEIYMNISDINNAILGGGWCIVEDDLMSIKICDINYKK